jgi:hypothetical protein
VVPGSYVLHLGGGQPRYAKGVTARLVVKGAAVTLPQ